MFMPAPSISSVTTSTRNIPTLTIYEDFDKIIAKEVCFTETGEQWCAFDCVHSLHACEPFPSAPRLFSSD